MKLNYPVVLSATLIPRVEGYSDRRVLTVHSAEAAPIKYGFLFNKRIVFSGFFTLHINRCWHLKP